MTAGKRAAATTPALPARGDIWSVDFEPQTHKEEPGKSGRPAVVLQADALNAAAHPSTIVVPGTSKLAADDAYPLRVRLEANAATGLRQTTDLLVDQVRAVSNRRLLQRLGAADAPTLARIDQALRWLTT